MKVYFVKKIVATVSIVMALIIGAPHVLAFQVKAETLRHGHVYCHSRNFLTYNSACAERKCGANLPSFTVFSEVAIWDRSQNVRRDYSRDVRTNRETNAFASTLVFPWACDHLDTEGRYGFA